MRQNLISIGDDFWIENGAGQRVFRVDGKALRVRHQLEFDDARGNELCRIQERMLRIKDTMDIEGPGGEKVATVKKALITPLRERWHIEVANGPDMEVQGNIVDHEYRFEGSGHQIAEVSKKWFRVRDTYGVTITPGENDVVILASTVAIDMMAHSGR